MINKKYISFISSLLMCSMANGAEPLQKRKTIKEMTQSLKEARERSQPLSQEITKNTEEALRNIDQYTQSIANLNKSIDPNIVPKTDQEMLEAAQKANDFTKLKLSLQKSSNDLTSLKAQLENYKQETDKLQKQLNDLHEQIAQNKGDKEQLSAQINQLENTLAERSNIIQDLNQKISMGTETISQQTQSMNNMEQKIQALESKVSRKKIKIRDLRGTKEQLEKSNLQQQESIQDMQSKLEAKTKSLEDTTRLLSAKEANYNEIVGLKRDLDSRLEELRNEKMKIENNLIEINKQLSVEQGDKKNLQKAMSDNISKISQMNEDILSLQQKGNSVNEENERLKNEILDLKAQIGLLNKILGTDMRADVFVEGYRYLENKNIMEEARNSILQHEIEAYQGAFNKLKRINDAAVLGISKDEFSSTYKILSDGISKLEANKKDIENKIKNLNNDNK